MPRILGIDIPANKRIDVALRSIYGIGPTISVEVLANAKIDPAVRSHTLSEDDLATIAKAIQSTVVRSEQTRTENGTILVEGDLRRKITEDLKRLKSIKTYRGMRHARGLPVRGQRTQTNARTRKGVKKTVGAQSKKD
ncbi:MAG: 30S ribosomal protein S13 [Verrucomicrobiota bacterium]|nr:30S ribosomal protein S13 [Verrucomicrobiota bacterium]